MYFCIFSLFYIDNQRNGIPRLVPEKVKERLEKAFDLLQLEGYERRIIKPFTVFGFDLFQAGKKYRINTNIYKM